MTNFKPKFNYQVQHMVKNKGRNKCSTFCFCPILVLLMYKHLTLEQRYHIEALRKQQFSITRIAEAVGVHKSTVSRELKRNSIQSLHPPDRYKASVAHTFSCKRAYKPLNYKTKNPSITRRIVWLLRGGWSPEQIAHTCRNRGIDMLSTEGIYQWIYQNRGQDNQTDLLPLCCGDTIEKGAKDL